MKIYTVYEYLIHELEVEETEKYYVSEKRVEAFQYLLDLRKENFATTPLGALRIEESILQRQRKEAKKILSTIEIKLIKIQNEKIYLNRR